MVIFCVVSLLFFKGNLRAVPTEQVMHSRFIYFLLVIIYSYFCNFLKLPEPAPASCLPAGLSLGLVGGLRVARTVLQWIECLMVKNGYHPLAAG